MVIKDKITVKNYKCFDSEGGGFDRIKPINIIIGKNNSGKSSLVDLVQFLVQSQFDIIKEGRGTEKAKIEIQHSLLEEEVKRVFAPNLYDENIPNMTLWEYGKGLVGKKYTYFLKQNHGRECEDKESFNLKDADRHLENLKAFLPNIFSQKVFRKITAERDLIPEKSIKSKTIGFSGENSTDIIQEIINRTGKDSQLVEDELLNELNKIVNPDVIFTRILVQINNNEEWEIFFEDKDRNRIALSKMGSGIKTVLLVLLNLIVIPEIHGKNKDSYVFALEELENNLHPSLQRRLYNYIKEYSEKHQAYFFLTTHSNVVIDAFSTCENSQIIHVVNDGVKSTTSTVLSNNGTKSILNDLGLKASDILQSNGVIWVEGPSDRNYINKWLEILAPELKEGIHYSIMFYGGRLLSNLSFDFDWFNKDVIPLLKINSNAFVVIDRDGKTVETELNKTKTRISEEIGPDNYWITEGREIENYLSEEIIRKWLSSEHDCQTKFMNDTNTKLEDNIVKAHNQTKLRYNLSKTVYSSEIVKYFDDLNLDVLDLRSKLNLLISNIRAWNR